MLINAISYTVLALVLIILAGVLSGVIRFEFTLTKHDDDEADSFSEEYLNKFKDKMLRTKRRITEFAERARKEGILACDCLNERMLKEDEDLSLLYQGMQLAVAGTEPEDFAQWFDNVALCANNRLEVIYVELVKQGVGAINAHNSPNWIETLLRSFVVNENII